MYSLLCFFLTLLNVLFLLFPQEIERVYGSPISSGYQMIQATRELRQRSRLCLQVTWEILRADENQRRRGDQEGEREEKVEGDRDAKREEEKEREME